MKEARERKKKINRKNILNMASWVRSYHPHKYITFAYKKGMCEEGVIIYFISLEPYYI